MFEIRDLYRSAGWECVQPACVSLFYGAEIPLSCSQLWLSSGPFCWDLLHHSKWRALSLDHKTADGMCIWPCYGVTSARPLIRTVPEVLSAEHILAKPSRTHMLSSLVPSKGGLMS